MTSQGFEVGPAILDDSGMKRWDAFVREAPDACTYHQSGWLNVVRRAFGHAVHPLWACDGQRVVGILPMVHMKSLLFGNFLSSLPFFNYGGVLARNDEAGRALVAAGTELVRSSGAEYLELRNVGRRIPGLPSRNHKVSMRLDLSAGSEALWKGFKAKVRNQVRKAERSGLSADSGGIDLLDEFYDVFARNMRDLGTPVYSPKLFRAVLDEFPETSRVFLVRHGRTCVAGAVTVRFRGVFEVPWASSIRNYNSMCPNNLLYWTMIRHACEVGCRTFDFGRSTPGEGTYRFKKQWGAVPCDMHWQYWLGSGAAMPDISPDNPRYRMLVRTWQKLPVRLTRLIGPSIVRNIP